MTVHTIDISPIAQLTDTQFEQLCRANPDAKFEQTATGDLVIMAPTGGETGNSNFEISADYAIWNRQARLGYGFDSSTCFVLPNGAKRSPDVAWIAKDRWEALTPEQRKKFPPIAPDFVLELRSPSDDLADLQAKMREYLENGVKLGWLIDPETKQVEIYRLGQPVEVLHQPVELTGESVLPGFILNLHSIWA
jgi:Uma2 family endonuclease